MGSSTRMSMRESAKRDRTRWPARASPAATVEVTKSRRVRVMASPLRVAADHPQTEQRRDLAPRLRLEPDRHLALAPHHIRRHGILDVEKAMRIGELQGLLRDATGVHLNLEVRRRAAAVAGVVGRDQGHGMRRVYWDIVGEPGRAAPPRAAQDALRHRAVARLIIEG